MIADVRRPVRRWRFRAAAALVCLYLPATAWGLTIEFDYRFDTRGFFTDTLDGTPLTERRATLDHAARFFAGFGDELAAIDPAGGGTWSVRFSHPSFGGPPVTLTDEVIAADTLKVFVGGSTSAPGVLGFAGIGYDLTARGDAAFEDAVFTRGQPNARGAGASDYGTWGGSIWFNGAADWYFGIDDAGRADGQSDFLTTAIHELAHILGIGEADAWFAQQTAGRFTGEAASALHGGSVPLDPYGAHFAEGVMSHVNGVPQETLMDPSTPRGTRQLPTALDYAALADIGWEVSPAPVPLPAMGWPLLACLATVLVRRRRARAHIPAGTFVLLLMLAPAAGAAGYYPMYAAWPQAGGPGSPFTLTFSFSNLFDGRLRGPGDGPALSRAVMRDAVAAAFADYAAVLPIAFVERADTGPAPESGEYDPVGHADIRIGQVPHIAAANAYAYFPATGSGLAGDIVFNADRFGNGWTPTLFYAVAQHEIGHSLGMGHFIADDAATAMLLAADAYTGPRFPLDAGTIAALQGTYGAGTGSVTLVPLPGAFVLMAGAWIMLPRRRAARAINAAE